MAPDFVERLKALTYKASALSTALTI